MTVLKIAENRIASGKCIIEKLIEPYSWLLNMRRHIVNDGGIKLLDDCRYFFPLLCQVFAKQVACI